MRPKSRGRIPANLMANLTFLGSLTKHVHIEAREGSEQPDKVIPMNYGLGIYQNGCIEIPNSTNTLQQITLTS